MPVRPALTALITQQPLGGKAQFGGQRFGEMEVWPCAYGASSVSCRGIHGQVRRHWGRVKTYEAIVKGECAAPEVPESFKVLIKEMKSLCLNVEPEGHNNEVLDVSETHEPESAGKHVYDAMEADAKKTGSEEDEDSALDSLVAALDGLISDDLKDSDNGNDLIGGEE